jgi:hypothetical protein
MTDTVEVVAARPLMIPAGRLEAKELFPATTGHASQLAEMDLLVLADGKGSKLERAVAAGTQARKELDERFAKEAKEAEAKAAKASKTAEKEA